MPNYTPDPEKDPQGFAQEQFGAQPPVVPQPPVSPQPLSPPPAPVAPTTLARDRYDEEMNRGKNPLRNPYAPQDGSSPHSGFVHRSEPGLMARAARMGQYSIYQTPEQQRTATVGRLGRTRDSGERRMLQGMINDMDQARMERENTLRYLAREALREKQADFQMDEANRRYQLDRDTAEEGRLQNLRKFGIDQREVGVKEGLLGVRDKEQAATEADLEAQRDLERQRFGLESDLERQRFGLESERYENIDLDRYNRMKGYEEGAAKQALQKGDVELRSMDAALRRQQGAPSGVTIGQWADKNGSFTEGRESTIFGYLIDQGVPESELMDKNGVPTQKGQRYREAVQMAGEQNGQQAVETAMAWAAQQAGFTPSAILDSQITAKQEALKTAKGDEKKALKAELKALEEKRKQAPAAGSGSAAVSEAAGRGAPPSAQGTKEQAEAKAAESYAAVRQPENWQRYSEIITDETKAPATRARAITQILDAAQGATASTQDKAEIVGLIDIYAPGSYRGLDDVKRPVKQKAKDVQAIKSGMEDILGFKSSYKSTGWTSFVGQLVDKGMTADEALAAARKAYEMSKKAAVYDEATKAARDRATTDIKVADKEKRDAEIVKRVRAM